MSRVKSIPISYNGGSSFYVEPNLMKGDDENKEFVAILKSDLFFLNEVEEWRQSLAQLMSVQETALTSESGGASDNLGVRIGEAYF